MTVRTNKRAIYAAVETTSGTAESLSIANLIPVNDVANTPLVPNQVDRPELTGYFGAPGFGIADKTHTITITCPLLRGNTNANGKAIAKTPLDPLIRACGHAEDDRGANYTTASTGGATLIFNNYKPQDSGATTATILYQLDGVTQLMRGARGTITSISLVNAEFPTITFELQSSFNAPTDRPAPTGTRPKFVTSNLVTGAADKGTIHYPGLDSAFSNCIRGFTFSQGATISSRNCAIKQPGGKAIDYLQTGRNSTGSITTDVDPTTLASLFAKAGTEQGFSASMPDNPLLVFGGDTVGQFYFASDNILIGAPTEGDVDGLATYETPLVFKPLTAEGDYSFGWRGDTT